VLVSNIYPAVNKVLVILNSFTVQKLENLFLQKKKLTMIVDQSTKGISSLIMQTYQLAKEAIMYQKVTLKQ
jgi:hypothetical protein